MRRLLIRTGFTCIGLLAVHALPLRAQTVLDGVYTNAQAQRGARTYSSICAHCHEGGEPDADPLFGTEFIDRWREAPLSFLHGFFSANMPADEPGSLPPATYVDVLAFLLRENGYPAGTELQAATIDTTLLVGTQGPQPLPPSALVAVTGCVGPGAALNAATPPTRIRRTDAPSPAEMTAAAESGPGNETYVLRNADGLPEGRKVLVKGVLAAGQTINVLEFASSEQNCG